MSTVNLRPPSAEALGIAEGQPVVAEILDKDLDVVSSVSVRPGVEQPVEVPSGKYVVRFKLPDQDDVFAVAENAASAGRSAAAHWLRGVAKWIEPDDRADGVEHTANQRPSIRKGLSDVVATIASAATQTAGVLDLSQRGAHPQRPADDAAPPDELKDARAILWAMSNGTWTAMPDVAFEDLGDCRFTVPARPAGLYALQIGGPRLPWRYVMVPPSDFVFRVDCGPTSSRLDAGVVMRITLGDSGADAVLKYLDSGSTSDARVVALSLVDTVVDAPVIDPIVAVVGAYCLLRTGGHEPLKEWPNRLATMFPWLPDASLVHAWQLLEQPGVPALDLAQKRLIEAERAGIPIFTDGIQRLYNGLIAFRDDPETPDADEVIEAVKRLSPFLASHNPATPFTTFYGPDPTTPSISPMTGLIDKGVSVSG
jgi:hypothetical protein